MLSRLRGFVAGPSINRNYAESLLTGYGLMGLTILVQLVLIPLYLTHLGKAKFGILTMILAANNYAAIGITWLSGGMARILAERAALADHDGFRAAYACAKAVYVLYALIAIALFWLVAPWLLRGTLADAEVRTAIALSCLYFLLAYEYNADRLAFAARHWQARGNLREAAGQLLFALCVGLGLYQGWGLPGVIAAQIAGIVCTRFLAWRHWRRDTEGPRWLWPIPGLWDMLGRISGRMGRDYAIYGILLLTLQADALIIGWLAGPEAAASYYLLWRIPEVCVMLFWRIPAAYEPFFIAHEAQDRLDKLKDNYSRGLRAIAAGAALAALLYGLAGERIVHLWLGEHAPSGAMPYLVAAAAMFFLSVVRWPTSVAYALLNTTALVKITSLELGTKLVLLLLLLGTFGYLSPLIAITLAHACGVFYLYLRLGRHTIAAKLDNMNTH